MVRSERCVLAIHIRRVARLIDVSRPEDLSPHFLHNEQVPKRVCANGTSYVFASLAHPPHLLNCRKVFDNYAVTVMIGDDPYTLGLFDTAGEFAPLVWYWGGSLLMPDSFHAPRSGRLRSSPPLVVSPDRRLLGVLQRDLTCII